MERCPITLERLSALERAPFGLRSISQGEDSRGIWLDADRELAQSAGEAIHWFDGASLASFLVTGYHNPLDRELLRDPVNRRLLERSECESLDEYLAEHGMLSTSVAAAYDEAHLRNVMTGWRGIQNKFRMIVEESMTGWDPRYV